VRVTVRVRVRGVRGVRVRVRARVRDRVRVLGTHHLKDGTTVIAPSTTWPCRVRVRVRVRVRGSPEGMASPDHLAFAGAPPRL